MFLASFRPGIQTPKKSLKREFRVLEIEMYFRKYFAVYIGRTGKNLVRISIMNAL